MTAFESHKLPKKPLVEAIFELRWELTASGTPAVGQAGTLDLRSDLHYQLLLGRFSGRVEQRLPFYERLPAAFAPDEMVPHVVQHRFRVDGDKWPLAQIGPGILTYNETESYEWPKFRDGATQVIADWRNSYPKSRVPSVSRILLKYIDAVGFDYTKQSVLPFFEKLKIHNALAADFLSPADVSPTPKSLLWRSEFQSSQPQGDLSLQIATARKDDQPVVVWETTLVSTGNEAPQDSDSLGAWLESAHTTTSKIFFAMIEGELHSDFI